MSHYARLATLIVRLVGILIGLAAMMGFVYRASGGLFLDETSPGRAWHGARLLSAGVFVGVGVVVYALGKPIGRLVGEGLEP